MYEYYGGDFAHKVGLTPEFTEKGDTTIFIKGACKIPRKAHLLIPNYQHLNGATKA